MNIVEMMTYSFVFGRAAYILVGLPQYPVVVLGNTELILFKRHFDIIIQPFALIHIFFAAAEPYDTAYIRAWVKTFLICQ